MATSTLNIKINPEIDIAAVKAALGNLGDVSLNVALNPEAADSAINTIMNNLEVLEHTIDEGFNVNIGGAAAEKELEKLIKEAQKIDVNVDFSKFEKDLDNLTDEELAQFNKTMHDAFQGKEIDNSALDIKALASEFDKAEKNLKSMVDTQKKALAQLELTGQKGTDSYKQLKSELAANESQLKLMAEAAGVASSKMTFSDKLAKIGLITDGIQNMTSAVSDIAKPFVEMDTATHRIETLGGAAEKLAPTFRDMSLEMSKKVPIGAEILQTATYDALSAGIKATKEDITSFMSASAKLAVGGGEQVGNTVNLLSSMINAYGESASKTTEYSDILFQTVNLGKTTIPELAQSMSQVVPTAAAMGFSLKSVGASLALMTANGIPTNQATTKLNQLLIEIQKPSADLEKVFNKAGISAKSLGDKIKSGDVIGAFQDLQDAFKKSGQSATQSFSSAEAGAAFNVLTKDMGNLKSTFDSFDSATGTTDAAFARMSDSVENRAKQFKSTIDASFIGLLDNSGVFGTIALTAVESLKQVQPILSSMTAFKTLFSGLGASAYQFALSILSKVVPSLVTQTVAEGGATAAQYAFNAAALLNPYIIGAALLAGAVIGIIALANALSKSTKEQIDDNKAAQESIKSQIESNKQKQEAVKTNSGLIDSYEKLGSKQNKTAAETEEFKNIQLKLSQAYPGVIQSTDDFGTTLAKLKGKASENKEEIKNLGNQLETLQNQQNGLQLKEKTLNIKLATENATDAADNGYQKDLINKYKNAIDGAKNSDEVKNATYQLKMSLINGQGWEDMDAQEQKKLLESVDKMSAAGVEKADLMAKQSTEIMTNAINRIASNDDYNTTVEEISQKSGKSIDEVTAKIVESGAVQISQGKDADKVYDKIAATLHKSPEEVKKLVEAQKESKAVADAQVQSVKDLADAWDKTVSATESSYKSTKSAVAEMDTKYRDLHKKNAADLTLEEAQFLKTYSTKRAELKKVATQDVANSKAQKAESEALDKEFGKEEKKRASAKKSLLEQAEADLALANNKLETESQTAEINIKANAMSEKRNLTDVETATIAKNKLDTAKSELENLKDIYQAHKLIKTIDATTGAIEFTSNVKTVDKSKIQKALNDARSKVLAEESNVYFNLEGKTDPKQLAKELLEAQLALQKKKLDVKIEAGTIDNAELDKYFNQQSALLSAEIQSVNEKMEKASDNRKLEYQKQLIDLNVKELELDKERLDAYKKLTDKKYEILQASYDKENEKNKELAEKELENINYLYTEINEASKAAAQANLNAQLDSFDKRMNKELASVSNNEKAKTAIQNKYAAMKSDAQKRAASDELVFDGQLNGTKIAAQTAQDVNELERKKAQQQALLKIASESGDLTGYMKISEELDSIEAEINKKKDTLNNVMGILGSGLNDSLVKGISGDKDGAKKAMKQSLAEVAGYIQKMITAAAIEFVLKSSLIKSVIAATGFLAPVTTGVFIGTITAGLNAIIKPLLSGLLSFPTGGVFDSPQLAIVGDGARLGGENKEILLRSDQITKLMTKVLDEQKNSIANMFNSVVGALSSTQIVGSISGENLLLIQTRAQARLKQSTRG